LVGAAASILGAPPLRAALKALLDLADAGAAEDAALRAHAAEMAALSYPLSYMSVAVPAFDVVSDHFRGLKGSSLDIYRNPDKLLAAIEVMQPSVIGLAVTAARVTGNPRVFIPMHRGADGFMSEEAFERFYWPTFRELIEALVEAGLTPMPLFEGGYSSRLKYLAQLPPGKVAAHFDRVDCKQFKQMCGDVMCFWGNVPTSLLCAGTPQQVSDYVRELIELFADTGALMIDGSQGIPDEARPENVMAMRETVDEYGAL
jgi:uroporphyrinogen-III decarboxylase